MNCGMNISTGTYAKTTRNCCPPDKMPVVKTPGKAILFSPESPTDVKYSNSFTITMGMVALIDAYNMTEGSTIYVNRLVKSTTALPVGDNCDPCAMNSAYGTDGVVLFRERMRLGGNEWKLVEGTRPQLFIPIPGIYELELEDVEMLGDLEVEIMQWSAQVQYPDNYFAGILA